MAKPMTKNTANKRTTALKVKRFTEGLAESDRRAAETHNKTVNLVFAALISVFMLIIPFYRGLFFRADYIIAIIFVSLTFTLYLLYKLRTSTFKLIDTYMDIAVLAIPLVYIISFFFAANAKEAFDAVLIYSSYFMLFKITHSLSKQDKIKDIFIHIIIASTFLLSFTFILHIMNIHSFAGIFVSKRLFGLYQYPNTTASVLGAGIVLTINNLINADNLKPKLLYQIIFTALISSFIFTISRGGYLVLAGVLVLNFLFIDANSKLKFILSILISFISNSLFIYKFYTIVETEPKAVGAHYFISIIISAALVYLLYFIKNKLNIKLSHKRINIILLSFFAAVLLIIVFLFITKDIILLRFIPEAIANRLRGISFSTKNVSLRIYFSRDGLKILKDYPIFGAGGGAWKNLYRQYQSIPYNTTETHNFYVQYATETGILGLAALSAVLIFLSKGMYRSIRDKSSCLYIYLAAILILAHSALDFNLSLQAVGYLLWMIIGILNSHEGIKTVSKPDYKYAKILILLLSVTVLFASVSVVYGVRLGLKAVDESEENKDIERSTALFEKAVKFDRYNTVYRLNLAKIMNNQLRLTKDKKYFDDFMKQLNMIKKYAPYNYDDSVTICNMLFAIGRIEEASDLADERVLDNPMVLASYYMKIDINYQIAKYYLEKEEIKKAMPYLEKVLEAEKQMEAVNEKIRYVAEKSKIIEQVEFLELEMDFPEKVEAALRTLNMIKEDIEG